MKITSLRTLALAALAALALFAGTRPASAFIDVGINVGTPPPPPPRQVVRPWAPPYAGAVWIRPHQEWSRGRWVFVQGYYAYPPYPGAIYIDAHWARGHWHQGHWRRR